MKLLRQWGIIITICFAGEFFSKALHLPIPGNVTGMLLLFVLLCTNIIKVEMIESASDFLLEHMAFFFIPAGVGLIACIHLLEGKWLAFIGICLLTTIVVFAVTGHVVQTVKKFEMRFKRK